MTLADLRNSLKQANEAKDSVEFFDNDGAKLAYDTKLKNVFELNSFKMNIDKYQQYHCRSMEGLSEQISVMTPDQHSFYTQFNEY